MGEGNNIFQIMMICKFLTFELSGRRRQDARPGLAKMYRVPPDRAWWPAVGAPLERGVRPRSPWGCARRHAGHSLDSSGRWRSELGGPTLLHNRENRFVQRP